jgi:CrcB protein
LMQRRGITSLRYFLLPGFCGGLGTFSAVTYEAIAPDEGGIS